MDAVNLTTLVDLIEARLARDLSKLRDAFCGQSDAIRTRACSIRGLLPDDIARAIYAGFPPLRSMRRLSSLREHKYTSKQLHDCVPIVKFVTFAFQHSRIVSLVEQITGMQDLVPDSHLYAGGISSMVHGDYLHPHIDNSHDAVRSLYRRINLLYYVTPEWTHAHGGNLQLWDARVRERKTLVDSFADVLLNDSAVHGRIDGLPVDVVPRADFDNIPWVGIGA